MITKEKILDEIRRTTEGNNGKPLGQGRFEKETGIKTYDWGAFWPRFSEVLQEAGFMPNQFNSAYADDFLMEKIIGLTRKLGWFPTTREIRIEKNTDSEMPNKAAFERFGSKQQFVEKVAEFCKDKRYDDVIEICTATFKNTKAPEKINNDNINEKIGEVYLFKSGRYYKIGKTNDTVRRGKELKIQLPEKMELIHSIQTDDPSGIEMYWHKRFESKRMNGEWFNLTPSEIKAFKRWRRIY